MVSSVRYRGRQVEGGELRGVECSVSNASENRRTVVPSPTPGQRMYSPFVNQSGIIEIAPKEGGFPQFDHQCGVLFLVTVDVNPEEGCTAE